MSIQWQQGAVFDGAYTHSADVGGGITLHVWRSEAGVWRWYAERGGQEYPAARSEQSVGAAKAAAAAWWKAHGRIVTVRRMHLGSWSTYLAYTDISQAAPTLVEQPVEQLQQDGPGFSLTDPVGGPDAGAQIPATKPRDASADELTRRIDSLTSYVTSLERTLAAMQEVRVNDEHIRNYGREIAEVLAGGPEADMREACFWLREAIARLEAERAALGEG